MKEGFDVGLEMSGNPNAFRDMLDNMCHGGKIAMLGIPENEMAIDWTKVVFNMLTIKGIYGREMYETWYKMTVLIQGGLDIEPVITHRFHLHPFRAGLRGHVLGQVGQSRPNLEGGELMYGAIKQHLAGQLQEIRDAGLFKGERVITTPQQAHVGVLERKDVLNLCANNYLGLADHPEIVAAAQEALEKWGYGLASVRFICGTQQIHKQLEKRIAEFLGTDDTILYTSCFDANGGLFETLLTADDAILSDELNHASIIDGVRLSQGPTLPLPEQRHGRPRSQAPARPPTPASGPDRHRRRLLHGRDHRQPREASATWPTKHDALVMVDDSHAVGFMGKNGRGTHEYHDVMGRVDILTGTLGKALGGASGGYTTGRQEIIDILRQRSRPYLFSNTVAPPIVGASMKTLELLSLSTELRDRLESNTRLFRDGMTSRGFQITPSEHPIVPIMLGDAVLAGKMADALLDRGIYVVGFSYPVVPKGKARIRVQVSAAHTTEDLEFAMEAFSAVKTELGV